MKHHTLATKKRIQRAAFARWARKKAKTEPVFVVAYYDEQQKDIVIDRVFASMQKAEHYVKSDYVDSEGRPMQNPELNIFGRAVE